MRRKPLRTLALVACAALAFTGARAEDGATPPASGGQAAALREAPEPPRAPRVHTASGRFLPVVRSLSQKDRTRRAAATKTDDAGPSQAGPSPSEGAKKPAAAKADGEQRPLAPKAGAAPTTGAASKDAVQRRPGPRPRATARPRVAPCDGESPGAGARVFAPGESLVYDLDVMGVRAGTLVLEVDSPADGEIALSAVAKTNTFFENVRKVDGRATSFTRDGSLLPMRYREDATEDGVTKWAEVLFPKGRDEVDVRYAIGRHERHVRYRTGGDTHDVISIIYYLRTVPLEMEKAFCLDVYGNRKVWRVRGRVEAEEFVSTAAGGFKTWRLSGSAQRLDRPSYEKEVHVWISQDERRLPVAAMGVLDVGPVRAKLSQVDKAQPDTSRLDAFGTW